MMAAKELYCIQFAYVSLFSLFLVSLMESSMIFTANENHVGKVIKIYHNLIKTTCLLKCIQLKSFGSFTVDSSRATLCKCIQSEVDQSSNRAEKYSVLKPLVISFPGYGSAWTKVPLLKGITALSITTGQAGVWIINSKLQILYANGTYDAVVTQPQRIVWKEFKLNTGYAPYKISCGTNIVWTITSENRTFYKKTNSSNVYESDWIEDDLNLDQISLNTRTNKMWAINRSNHVLYRIFHPQSEPMCSYWYQVAGKKFLHVSVGDAGVWGVDVYFDIYYRFGNGTYGTGVNWTKVDSEFQNPTTGMKEFHGFLEVASGHGIVYGVTRLNVLLVRLGISVDRPTGNVWHYVDKGIRHIAVNNIDDTEWAITNNGELRFRRKSHVVFHHIPPCT